MHLYYNAFQPGSMMDVRSRTIEDPDSRVRDRISTLSPSEIGFQKIKNVKDGNGNSLSFHEDGTILEIKLNKPLKSGKQIKLQVDFLAQVPVQIRRTGRYNKENVAYSMTQWYPKMCEFDKHGWHTNPYIGREFYGVWGDFKVSITIDSSFVLGGTGIIQNPQEVGHGYQDLSKNVKLSKKAKKTWIFKADKVHDFAWAADPDFIHETTLLNNGTVLHFLHKDDTLNMNWSALKPKAKKCFEYMNENYGLYPYGQYSIIQGGDGGMEYPMCTLITAEGSLNGLISVTVHEAIHSWFQGLLGTNEAKHEWMDEGFCTYAQYEVLNHLKGKKVINPLLRQYKSYYRLVENRTQEPLSTHADFYKRNYVYGISAYNKGAVFLHQLGYVVGDNVLKKGLKKYINDWKFKHPDPTDFKRIMENISGLELDWYFEQFVETTNTIDYEVFNVEPANNGALITLRRIGVMPMPIDIVIIDHSGNKISYSIPLRIMRGNKSNDSYLNDFKILSDWPWVYQYYQFESPIKLDEIKQVAIDPSSRLADINPQNNVWSNNQPKQQSPIIYINTN
tara:strand:+ start:1 stop:1686 length:1686 start_codon:yes stop_codon:yes gene_type:complete